VSGPVVVAAPALVRVAVVVGAVVLTTGVVKAVVAVVGRPASAVMVDLSVAYQYILIRVFSVGLHSHS